MVYMAPGKIFAYQQSLSRLFMSFAKQLIQWTRRKTPPHRATAHTTTHIHTQKEHCVCVCCLPAQFVSNLICILTTFCVWLKRGRGKRRGGSKKNTGQRATKGVTATCAKCVKRQNNNIQQPATLRELPNWSPTLAAGAARKLRTN